MTAVKRRRCVWAEGNPVMRHYHDTEWGVPQRDPRALWEMLMLEGFQAGLAWIVVLRKRDAFRAAFSHFRPQKVAHYRENDVVRLLDNPNIIRSRAKIESTIKGAKIYSEMAARGEDFAEAAKPRRSLRPQQSGEAEREEGSRNQDEHRPHRELEPKDERRKCGEEREQKCAHCGDTATADYRGDAERCAETRQRSRDRDS